MTLRQAAWLTSLLFLTLLVTYSAPAFPTETEPSAPAGPSGEEQKETAEPDSPQAQVEKILKEQESLLRGQRFSYDPGDRRDPFRSLYEPVKDDRARPAGIAGTYVDEIDLNGIIQDPAGGDLAYVTGSDNKGYFMRVGQSVYDGYLLAIDPGKGSVTFRQKIDDPRQIKPYRDVVRKLVPEEGADD